MKGIYEYDVASDIPKKTITILSFSILYNYKCRPKVLVRLHRFHLSVVIFLFYFL